MKWKWLTRRRKKPARDRAKDWNRHYRVAKRLQLRLDEAVENQDIERVDILLARLRRVRDIQIRDIGY